jgi:hypothetical protein
MKPDYLTLINGRKIRILFNMNAVGEIKKATGLELVELGKVDKDLDIIRTIVYICANEGERADGKDLGMSEVDLGGMMSISNMVEFAEIFSRQGFQQAQKKRPAQRAPWWRRVKTS